MTDAAAICAQASALAGLTEDDDAYRAIVDPAGAPSEEALVAHDASSCMLVRAWLKGWRGRFVPSTIQTTLRELEHGTGRVPDVDNFCGVGAGLWWAKSAFAEEHVDACVLAVGRVSLYAVTLDVVAGGQRVTDEDVRAGRFRAGELGKRCIKRLVRLVCWDGRGWVAQADGRRVLGVLDP